MGHETIVRPRTTACPRGSGEHVAVLNAFTLAAAPTIFKWGMIAIMRTCRIRTFGAQAVLDLQSSGRPWLYCTWHHNTAMTVCRLRNRRLAMMASASRDGELIARAIEKLGNKPIRGSSSFRGSQAARDMIRVLRGGASGAMTPDGPRGPALECQPGAIWIAALTGCPLVPYQLEAERQWYVRSWDRHKIPKWFTTIHEHIGEPMYVSRADLAEREPEILEALQNVMLSNTRRCLEAAGHPAGALNV